MAAPEPARASVGDRRQAEQLVGDLVAIMAELGCVLDGEREHLAAGRIRAGLALEPRKAELAAGYLRGLEAVKANAVAIKRLAPAAIGALREAQQDLQASAVRSQTVIETARAVAEGLVRTLAAEMEQKSRPSGYGTTSVRPPRPVAGPLAVSARF